jgi:hypothetical protein
MTPPTPLGAEAPLRAQLLPADLEALSHAERLQRLADLAGELYADDDDDRPPMMRLAADMGVTRNTVRRWFRMHTPVPLPVLVAAGAMLHVKRTLGAVDPV